MPINNIFAATVITAPIVALSAPTMIGRMRPRNPWRSEIALIIENLGLKPRRSTTALLLNIRVLRYLVWFDRGA